MKIQKTYSAEEFADKVGEKVGNIRLFRKYARKFGLIDNHEVLTEDFLPAWDIAQKLHYQKGVKWENAIKHGLSEEFGIPENESTFETEIVGANIIEHKLDEIIEYLKRITIALENKA
ncbi:hypothetical protein D1B33_04835 [Lysinibacillus yapensis]|uniref:MerR family transcriptional regulator n=1 Tax=Ureibacillus yapensis TaxID=2304605 RepID=A0A396SGM0_9BACL|nr:hypothetical protein [Lysinibacillus yapensis]RHW38217.1 hypothetical protein D1B33_04835 [Lysinibacillus yapensis]